MSTKTTATATPPREYRNLSDFLSDHAAQLVEDYARPAFETDGFEWDYTGLRPEIACVQHVMLALTRALDDFDADPRAVFRHELLEAVAKYQRAALRGGRCRNSSAVNRLGGVGS